MIRQFEGAVGRGTLIQTLREQKIVAGDTTLATQIADRAVLLEVSPGTAIIEQWGTDNDVYFIIAGAFDIVINGRKLARRFPNDHVGEMAAVQPGQRRSATVIATEESVVCKLSAEHLVDLAQQHQDIWQLLSNELARRLDDSRSHSAL